jgi:uncharacterized membrane protein YgdD (TMEM256/DUF423 family)
MNKKITAFACIGIALGIVLGAFGAHGLRQVTDDASIMNSYKTGVDYHLFHSVAFLIFGLLGASVLTVPIRKSALTLIFIGILLFSGSLYLLTWFRLNGWSYAWIGPITPMGGTLLIAGWAWLAYSLLRPERSN